MLSAKNILPILRQKLLVVDKKRGGYHSLAKEIGIEPSSLARFASGKQKGFQAEVLIAMMIYFDIGIVIISQAKR